MQYLRKYRFAELFVVCVSIGLLQTTVAADDEERAIDHAPIGVMGDHYHEKGEWMLSARYMRMAMSGNRNNTTDLSDQDIIEMPNPYQMGDMSTKLSVVPQDMAMNMTMLGLMYAPSDMLTLMGMGMFTHKTMDLNTYQGAMPMNIMGGMGNMNGMGTMGGMSNTSRELLGSFSTSTTDLTDVSLSGLVKLYEAGSSRLHAQLGIQQSVGSSDTTGEVLTPMNMRMTMTLPYGMQSGDGSTSLLSALTYVAKTDGRVYGGQIRGRNAIAKDSWAFGDTFLLTGWVQQELGVKTSLSFRATHYRQKMIDGRNAAITAPVQTANPANYGGTITELSVGLNQLVSFFPGDHADRIGVEVSYPVHQQLSGLQMKSGITFQVGYQKSLF